TWRPLSPMPNQMDQYCIPPQTMFTGMVKVEACDLAGNTVNREFNIGTTMQASMTVQEPIQEKVISAAPEKGTVRNMPMNVEPISSKAPTPFPLEQVSGPDIEPLVPRPQINTAGLLPADTRMSKTMPGDMTPGPVTTTTPKPRAVNMYLVNKMH